MKKQIFILVLVSGILSASMLVIGTTVLGKYSPVLASSLGALVSGTEVNGTGNILSVEKKSAQDKPEQDNLPKKISTPMLNPALWAGLDLSNTTSGVEKKASLTISDLAANPGQYMNQMFTMSGMASLLSDNKILINDGTGEVLIIALNGLWETVTLDNQMITITGWLKSFSSVSGLEASVCSITGEGGVLFIDVCTESRPVLEPQITATQPQNNNRNDNPPKPTLTSTPGPTTPPTDEPKPTDKPKPTDEPPPTDEPTQEPRPTENPDDHDNGRGNDDKPDSGDDSSQSSLIAPEDILTLDQLVQETVSFTTELSNQITDGINSFFSDTLIFMEPDGG